MIVLFGAFWGFMEATLGGALHAIRFPLTGSIMAPIGFAVLFAALRCGARPGGLVAISAVAASFKFLDVLLFNLSPFQAAIVNPAQAILMQGLSFTAFARSINSPLPAKRLLASTGMAVMSIVLFNLVGYFIAGQSRVPLFASPLAVLGFHLPLTVIATYLLVDVASRIEQAKMEMFTLKGSSLAVRAAACAALIVVSMAAQKWFY